MKSFKSHTITIVGNMLLALVMAAGVTLILMPLSDYLGAQIVALVYILPVLLSVYFLGLFPAIVAAIASFLCLNYFFIPPTLSLLVHQAQDLLTLLVFLIVAVFTSQLIAKARQGMKLAKQREWEATSIYQLILSLSGANNLESIAHILAQHTFKTIPSLRVEILLQPNFETPAAVVENRKFRLPFEEKHLIKYPLLTSRSYKGEIKIWVDHPVVSGEEDRLLSMYANQGALALERIDFFAVETRAHILEETDQVKSTLLSSVSHELRSPLAVIKASVSSLRSGMIEWDSDAHLDLLSSIEEETDHLNFLVGNLLDMSRIEAGALTLHKKWNSLAEIANEALRRMQKLLEDFTVEINISMDLPLVFSDFVLLEQVFTNLISNSVKYAPSGTHIFLSATHEGDYIHTLVTNQGPGVPEEDLDRIFEKFHQVNKNDRIMSTGLGLSICKGVVSAHFGKIWAENRSDAFVFHFTLPTKSEDNRLPASEKVLNE